MSKGFERYFSKENLKIGQYGTRGKMLNVSHKEKQIKTQWGTTLNSLE